METLQLRYFYETAKNESVTKTAQKFMVSVPSVSATIKKLEQELGTPLFDRSSNRIVLNENGKRFLESVSLILSEIEHVKYEFSNEEKDTRKVKILVLAIRDNIADLIISFKKTHYGISFKTVFDYNETNFDNYDIVIAESSTNIEGFESIEMIKTRIRIGASKSSPLLHKKLTLKQLENEPFISLGEKDSMQKALTQACKRAGFTPNVVVQCNDSSYFDRCIRNGIGIGVIRERNSLTPLETMDYLDVADFNCPYTVNCFYKKQAYYGNVKKFIDFFAER